MDRVIIYPASIPRSVDLLQTNRNVMTALGMFAQELLGTNTIASGFTCTPTSPAGLAVVMAPGRLYSLQETDPLAYSTLPADTTDLIVKQGIVSTSTTLACPAPTTSGYSVNYLIEAAFQETDTNPVVLPYYNAANPSQPFSGPNNSGSTNYTSRQDTVQIQVKAGTPATTGTQTTPAPDTGFVGIWVVTVAYGQTTITSGNITAYPNSPLLGGSFLQGLQANSFTTGTDIGVANAYAVNFAPAITSLVDNMVLEFQAAFANTAASTFAANAIAAAPIVNRSHVALQGGEIAAGSKVAVIWKANINSWVLLQSTGGSTIGGSAGVASHIGWTPGGASSDVLTKTFTASCNGTVIARSVANSAANQTQNVSNVVSINGSPSPTDNIVGSSTVIWTQPVTAGTAVTVTGTLAVGAATSIPISHWLEYQFIPS